jgi:hypothetical protein
VSATPVERERPSEIAAGYLAAISLAASAIALVYRPVRLAPFAILVGLVAAAVAVATLAWLVGMTIAVLLSRPIY